MRKGLTAAVIGAVVSLGGVAAAQAPLYTAQADRGQVQGKAAPGGGVASQSTGFKFADALQKQLKLTGNSVVYVYNVVFQVNGVTVRADRAVINGGEVALDGNVRLTMPQSK